MVHDIVSYMYLKLNIFIGISFFFLICMYFSKCKLYVFLFIFFLVIYVHVNKIKFINVCYFRLCRSEYGKSFSKKSNRAFEWIYSAVFCFLFVKNADFVAAIKKYCYVISELWMDLVKTVSSFCCPKLIVGFFYLHDIYSFIFIL